MQNKYLIGIVTISLILGYLVTDFFIKYLISYLVNQGYKVITLNPLEIINILIYGTIITSIIILLPIIIYLSYDYLKDTLYEYEKKIVKSLPKYFFLPIIGAIFGIITTHYFILPFLFKTMNMYLISSNIGLHIVLKLYLINALIMAIIFSMPILIKILSKINLIKKTDLINSRKGFYLASIILLALVTPTTDAITLSIMFMPMVVIYEISILSIRQNINISSKGEYV